MTSLTPAGSSRLRSLDGLRGVASLVVVFHHLSLTIPGISDVLLGTADQAPPTGSAAWWLTSTPAQLLVAGPEAVLVFFVLSGLVVALPVLSRPRFDWIAFYPQRLLRLYLPIIASVLLAAVVILLSHQHAQRGQSGWVSSYSLSSLSWAQVLSSMDVVIGQTNVNNPLWSLRWEVLFSLALPVFVVIAVVTRRFWWLAIIGCFGAALIGLFGANATFVYLPAFLIGTVIAVRLDALHRWVDADGRRALAAGLALLVLSLLLLTLHWTVWAVVPGSPIVTILDAAEVLGAAGLVLAAGFWKPLVRLLSTSLFQWLGRISFSLYLVHVPIILAVANVLGPGHTVLVIGVAFVVAVIVAMLFARFVEQPAHRLSRRAGAAAAESFARWQDR
jgi:peptidoglycan/LPS O-acetylase OafA/YrhL